MSKEAEILIDDEFQIIENGKVLLPTIEKRLPAAASIYNMALMHEHFLEELKIYTLNRVLDTNAWIVVIFDREDYGRNINISAPPTFGNDDDDDNQEPSSIINAKRVKNAFINSKLFNWDKQYFFTALELPVSKMIFEISCHIKKNKTTVSPGVVYVYTNKPTTLTTTQAQKPHENRHSSSSKTKNLSITIKSLNSPEGINFIHDNWAYSKEGTKAYVEKIIHRNPSSGIYINNHSVPISGVVTTTNGYLGMLFTHPEWRNHHFGSIIMKNLIQQLLELNYLPCSVVEEHNKISRRFHEKLGMVISHPIDFVFNW